MSMIYECPNCHTPQGSGRTVCRYCGAEFDSPVPDDAFVPDGTAPEPPPPAPVVADAGEAGSAGPIAREAEEAGATVYKAPAAEDTELIAADAEPMAADAEPTAQEASVEEPEAAAEEPLPPQPDTSPPPVEVAPPSTAETLPYQSSPYPSPAYQAAPTYAEQANPTAGPPPSPQRPPPGKALTRALLIAFPIVLVLVLGAVFFAHSLDSGQDTAPAPLPAIVPASTPAASPTTSGTPAAPPYVLNGTVATTGSDEDPRTRRMVGRWESKNLDFYVFNENKTGTRGSLTGKGPQGTFLWTLVQNHLILYGDKQEQLTYTKGPDEDTMFLKGASGGKYVQYARTKMEPVRQ